MGARGLVLVGAGVTLLATLSGVLWLKYAPAIYLERIATAIVNCL